MSTAELHTRFHPVHNTHTISYRNAEIASYAGTTWAVWAAPIAHPCTPFKATRFAEQDGILTAYDTAGTGHPVQSHWLQTAGHDVPHCARCGSVWTPCTYGAR